ncbi:MAG: helix-turn-helix transcriptional regulator [Magnetococcales bacterium]|nr:helix-turn-helix transcriptional regulator [Magnetococcales bacterium]
MICGTRSFNILRETVQTTPQNDLALRIKRLRTRMGMTQVALAKELGVSFPTINRWENGKAKPSRLAWERLLELAGEAENGRAHAT